MLLMFCFKSLNSFTNLSKTYFPNNIFRFGFFLNQYNFLMITSVRAKTVLEGYADVYQIRFSSLS